VLLFEQVDSTNSIASSLAVDVANDGTVILAEEQRAGRGRQGHSWHCPRGSGVLLSVLVFPPSAVRRPAVLTAWAAVAVCETIAAATGLQAKIKWPNDVLLHGRKLCGILVEQGAGTVVGIGLNVNQSAPTLATAGLTEATSLAALTGAEHDCHELAELLIAHLDSSYHRLSLGDFAELEACWKSRTGLIGHQVRVECKDQRFRGRLRDLSWDRLEVQLADGGLISLRPETVQHVDLE
jgi:BirA family biotin operon repressor/biotin-[acetyl-CoA-carboxylase] ligase